jgi:hypothetical protein
MITRARILAVNRCMDTGRRCRSAR